MYLSQRVALAAACLIGSLVSSAARAAGPEAALADVFGDPLPPGAVARLGTARLRHACVWLAWAPDGKTFATAGTDGALRVWDGESGKVIREIRDPRTSFLCVVYDPDGKRLIAGGPDGALHLLDPATGREGRTFGPAPQQIVAMACRPDEGTVLTLGPGGALRSWDLMTGKIIRQTTGTPGVAPFQRVALSPDGRLYASWGPEDVLTVRDADGKELFHAPTQFKAVDGLTFSADGKVLAASSAAASQVALWDTATGKELRRLDGVHTLGSALVFSPNGKYLAGKGGDGAVHVWGATSGQDLRKFELPQGMLVGTPAFSGTPLAFSPDSKTLAAAQGLAIHLWDVGENKERREFVGHNAPVDYVRFSADGRRVLTWGRDGEAGQWEATGKLLAWRTRSEGGNQIAAVAAPDGKTVLLAMQGGVARWDLGDAKPAERLLVSGSQTYLAALVLSADGKTLAGYSPERFIYVWDAETGKELAKVRNEQQVLPVLALSADGGLLAIGLPNAPVRLWDVAAKQEVRLFDGGAPAPRFTPLPDPVPVGPFRGTTHMAFAPDGRTLVAASVGELVIWEVATGRDRLHVAMPNASIGSIAISPDGSLVAGATGTGEVLLLDATDGWESASFANPGEVSALAFAPDGKTLASAGRDGTVLIWDVKEWAGRKRPVVELPPEKLPVLWKDLLDGDAGRAYKAVLALASSPKAAAPYLKERLSGGEGPDAKRIAQLIKDLNDDQFDAREDAEKELDKMGLLMLPAVRQALAADPPAEARRRLKELLDRHKDSAAITEEMRGLRALEALERGGAADVLEALAKEAPNAVVKQQAAAALDRLARRKDAP